MRFKNTSDKPVSLVSLGLGEVSPKAEIEIPDYLWQARRAANGSRAPSILELTAPQMQPTNDEDAAAWERVPEAGEMVSRLRGVSGAIVASLPPGVQAAVKAKAAPVPAPKVTKPVKAPAAAPGPSSEPAKEAATDGANGG